MGVYIEGMEMPKEGSWTTVRIYPDGTCAVPNWQGDCTLIKGAKAVPVPPHGRLIDADVLEKDIDKYIGGEESRSRFHHWVQVQNAVIPGDKGGQRHDFRY